MNRELWWISLNIGTREDPKITLVDVFDISVVEPVEDGARIHMKGGELYVEVVESPEEIKDIITPALLGIPDSDEEEVAKQ